MKRMLMTVTALFLFAGIVASCSGGGGGGGNNQSGSDTGVGFGIKANDQLRRYQTFIAGSHPTMTGVEVRVRKKSAADFYSCLSAELYETDAQHRPSVLLAMTSIPTVTLGTDFTNLGAPLSYHGLASGKEYAVVLEQYDAFGANAGFEWSVSDVSASTYFGKQENGVWTDESSLGDGWLSVSADDSIGTNPAAGSPDTSFGTAGTMTSAIPNSPAPLSAVIQPDGKTVIAFFDVMSQSGFIVARYNSDGSPDTTFHSTGLVSTPIGTSISEAVAIQPDGKLVVAGGSSDGSNNVFALARYNVDGSLDTAFHSTGTVTTPIESNSYATAVAIQPDGKIVAAGDSTSGFALARYNSDGSLDTSFNTSGTVTAPTAPSNLHALAIRSDGKIVAVGTSPGGFTLVRYNINGSPDTTFNSTGTVATLIGTDSAAKAVALQPDGKIVVAGMSYSGGVDFFALARYNVDGSLDTTLNSTGTVTTLIGTDSAANAVALQPDGKIVVAGIAYSGGAYSFALARYNGDGSLDTTFNATGTIIKSIGASSGANAVAIGPDGKITAVGNSGSYVAVVRYNP